MAQSETSADAEPDIERNAEAGPKSRNADHEAPRPRADEYDAKAVDKEGNRKQDDGKGGGEQEGFHPSKKAIVIGALVFLALVVGGTLYLGHGRGGARGR